MRASNRSSTVGSTSRRYCQEFECAADSGAAPWQWWTASGWHNYSSEVCEKLAKDYYLGRDSCIVRTVMGEFEVNFNQMTQRSLHDPHGRERKVRHHRQSVQIELTKSKVISENARGSACLRSKSHVPSAVCSLRQDTVVSNNVGRASSNCTLLLRQIVHPLFVDITLIKKIPPAYEPLHIPQPFGNVALVIMKAAQELAEMIYHKVPCVQLTPEIGVQGEIVMAGICMGLFVAGVHRSSQLPSFRLCLHSTDMEAMWQDWKYRSNRLDDSEVLPLTRRGHVECYNWIHTDNSAQCRLERLVAAAVTLRYGFCCQAKAALLRGTKLLPEPKDEDERVFPKATHCTTYLSQTTSAMEIAVEQKIHRRKKVVLVSAASAYHVGGGFLTGGRHALEEAICMQSTLFYSLQEAQRQAKKRDLLDISHSPIHIPEIGAVLSPSVTVFRNGTAQGYSLQEQVVLDAVISVAMPNRNPNVRDSHYDARDRCFLKQLMEQKFVRVLQAAANIEAEVLVIPDVGCGIFRNNPSDVGGALANAMRSFDGAFEAVILTGCDDFTRSALRALGSSNVVDHPQIASFFSLRRSSFF